MHRCALASVRSKSVPAHQIDVLQHVSAHQHTRSTNCLSQLTACRACLVGADTGAQAPAAKRCVESAEALSAAGPDELGLTPERSSAARAAFGSPRSAMLLPARPRRAVADGCGCPHWRPCCARLHADIEPSPAGHVPSGSWWAWGEPLASSSLVTPGLCVLVITPDLIASEHRLHAMSEGCYGVAPRDSQTSQGGRKSIGGQHMVISCRYVRFVCAPNSAGRPLQI